MMEASRGVNDANIMALTQAEESLLNKLTRNNDNLKRNYLLVGLCVISCAGILIVIDKFYFSLFKSGILQPLTVLLLCIQSLLLSLQLSKQNRLIIKMKAALDLKEE